MSFYFVVDGGAGFIVGMVINCTIVVVSVFLVFCCILVWGFLFSLGIPFFSLWRLFSCHSSRNGDVWSKHVFLSYCCYCWIEKQRVREGLALLWEQGENFDFCIGVLKLVYMMLMLV